MKKTLLSSFALLATGALFAQLPVSTQQQTRKVLLEEFTGYTCTYCPDGHKKADQLVAANPGNVFVVNIHTGSYSTPASGKINFQTSFGTSLMNQSGLTGFPAGTINREVFPSYSMSSGSTAMSRSYWGSAANTVMTQNSYLNVAMQATINSTTRELVVDVEVYYTGNSPQGTNKLNIALVQDGIMETQTGGSTWYPEMVVGGLYTHNKVLRHLLTGQYGDAISPTTQGTKITKQYTYTLPSQLPLTVSGGALKSDVVLTKLKLIAFVTEGNQFVVPANTGPITINWPAGVADLSEEHALQVFPNPFNNNATFGLNLSQKENVNIKVYNIAGAEVFTYNESLNPGLHQINFDGSNLQEGMYIVKAVIGNKIKTEKITLVK